MSVEKQTSNPEKGSRLLFWYGNHRSPNNVSLSQVEKVRIRLGERTMLCAEKLAPASARELVDANIPAGQMGHQFEVSTKRADDAPQRADLHLAALF